MFTSISKYEPKYGKRNITPFYQFIQKNLNRECGPKGQHIGVRAVLGRWDHLGQNHVIKQWISYMPQIKDHVKFFKDVGHFIKEIKPKEIVLDILRILN